MPRKRILYNLFNGDCRELIAEGIDLHEISVMIDIPMVTLNKFSQDPKHLYKNGFFIERMEKTADPSIPAELWMRWDEVRTRTSKALKKSGSKKRKDALDKMREKKDERRNK